MPGGFKKERIFFFKLLHHFLRLILHTPRIIFTPGCIPGKASVLVANHENSWGPIAMVCFYPGKLYAWVLWKLITRKACRRHIKTDFIHPELKLKAPLSSLLAYLIELICLPMMKYLEVIPVYRQTSGIRKTIDITLDLLIRGKQILIFPENSSRERVEKMLKPFYPGFVNLARLYYKRTGLALLFYPVSVNRAMRTVRIGKPVSMDPGKNFRKEKSRILSYLSETIKKSY